MTVKNIKNFLYKKRFLIAFLFIVLVGLYLRFWNFENSVLYTWDQGRDAWKTRDILTGQIVLNGPRTGLGHVNLGPLWYYLLAPFYYFSNLDPVGAIYLNIFVSLFNFISAYWVTKKIYNDYAALFVTLILAVSRYLMGITQIPWNVSPIFGVSILIFYSIYKIVFEKNYKWIPILAFLTGLFEHLHFSVVFLPPIILLSLVFAKDKKKIFLRGLASLPFFLIWLIPNVLWDIQSKNSNLHLFQNFLNDYLIKGGFHFRFFLFRLHDAFIQFQTVLSFPHEFKFLKFIIPAIFAIFIIFEKDKKKKHLGYLMSLWFIVPAFMYAFYGGSTSEYYVLINAPMVLYILIYLQGKLLQLKRVPILLLFIAVWSFYIYYNTKDQWIKPVFGGLAKQKHEVREAINQGRKIEYNEGVIESYLYFIWTNDGKRF